MEIRPYGDTKNDGMVQLSFTLPVPDTPSGIEAARLFVLKLGFERCEIVMSSSLSEGFTMFIAYAKTNICIDLEDVVIDPGLPQKTADFNEINKWIERDIGRKVIIVGAATGSDAHTVGIDAIMNMKGCDHHYGLERYPMIEAINLGAQVENEKLIETSLSKNADVILISQVVTQKDVHIKNLKKFISLLEKAGMRNRFIVIVGGPRVSHSMAIELGFDAGFGKGTYSEDVATLILERMLVKLEQ